MYISIHNLSLYIYIHTYCVCVYVYLCIFIYTFVCVCVCVYIYIYTWRERERERERESSTTKPWAPLGVGSMIGYVPRSSDKRPGALGTKLHYTFTKMFVDLRE